MARTARAGLSTVHRRALRALSRAAAGAHQSSVLGACRVGWGDPRGAALSAAPTCGVSRRDALAHAHDGDGTRHGAGSLRRPCYPDVAALRPAIRGACVLCAFPARSRVSARDRAMAEPDWRGTCSWRSALPHQCSSVGALGAPLRPSSFAHTTDALPTCGHRGAVSARRGASGRAGRDRTHRDRQSKVRRERTAASTRGSRGVTASFWRNAEGVGRRQHSRGRGSADHRCACATALTQGNVAGDRAATSAAFRCSSRIAARARLAVHPAQRQSNSDRADRHRRGAWRFDGRDASVLRGGRSRLCRRQSTTARWPEPDRIARGRHTGADRNAHI